MLIARQYKCLLQRLQNNQNDNGWISDIPTVRPKMPWLRQRRSIAVNMGNRHFKPKTTKNNNYDEVLTFGI